jgi:ribose transport system substrate-binding protein
MNLFNLVLCGLAVAALTGCSRQEPAAAAPAAKPSVPEKKLTLAVIPKSANQVFWKSVRAGAVKAAQESNVEVIWKGPLPEDDRESQIKVLEDFITRRVSGIVLAPLDDTALCPAVDEAARQNIPVVIIDSPLKSDKPVSFVATHNLGGGTRAGRHLAKLLDAQGKVILLRFLEGSASTEQRVQGFLEAIKIQPKMSVVSEAQRSGSTAEVAYRASENLLSPLLGADGRLRIDGIFCPNEFTTFAMLRALQDLKLAGTVKFVGFDSSEMLVAALKRGELQGLILQDPINMGYLGVKTMVAHLRGQKVEPVIDTGSNIATPENMNDPAILALLNPDYKKWLKED